MKKYQLLVLLVFLPLVLLLSQGHIHPLSQTDHIVYNQIGMTFLKLKELIKASKVNFDWDSEAQIVEKILEEIEEYSQAAREENEFAKLEEFGDILFSVVNLGRFSGLDPETALRFSNEKFIQRVVKIDKSLKNDGSSVLETDRKQLNKLWEKIKKTDKDFDQ